MFSAENLVHMRKERKLSQEEVARRCGLATATISKLEEGKTSDPRMSTICKLAKGLGCSVDAFFYEESGIVRSRPFELPSGNACNKLYSERTFIDLFAGAGCLSLGLMSSGWRGILAVEKNAMAFETLSHNLLKGTNGSTYEWPVWFPQQSCTVGRFADTYRQQLLRLRGTVTMIVGGPPCQGFSLAGKRNKKDTRNSLFKAYIRIVETVQPLFILLENVNGITMEFDKKTREKKKAGRPPEPFSRRIIRALEKIGYEVRADLLRAADFGVPQLRPRYFLIATRRGVSPSLKGNDPFRVLDDLREGFLRSKGLPEDRLVSVKEAISDLETVNGTEQCVDSPRFMQGTYAPPTTHFQRLMRRNHSEGSPDSHRLANHRPETVARFDQILATCRRGVQLSQADRERFGLKKRCTVPLDPDQPSHTLTTLPDDIIHYSEARILTVREYARLQSIPDWFQFRGAYTTGGDRRVRECPRYTQAGNAVPPFVGEAIGILFTSLHNQYLGSSKSAQPLSSARTFVEDFPVGES